MWHVSSVPPRNWNIAAGYGSFAAGYHNNAASSEAMALGNGNYAAYNAVAIGQANSATSAWSLAIGGFGNTASNEFSTAMGGATLASGFGATSTGYGTVASGQFSATFNQNVTAASSNASAFGEYNLDLSESGATPSATTWVTTPGSADPLFEIGNGTSSTAKSDAFVVYKDGNATVQGTLRAHTGLRCAPGGDLSMGSFTAGTAP